MKNGSMFQRLAKTNYLRWLFFIVFLYFYLGVFKNALIDDAYITLRYAKTLLTSGTWGFFPQVVANSATSPLNILLLACIGFFTGATVPAVMWMTLICLTCIAILLTRLSVQVTGTEAFGWLAVSALIFNPLLISTLGLESVLFTTLFVSAIFCCHAKKWILLAVALGFLTLTRAEGALFFLVFLPFVPTNRIKIQLAAAYFLCIAPWYFFSWLHLGSFVPDTFFIKTDQGAWWQWDFFNGVATLYYYVYPVETILSFAFLPLLTLLLNKPVRELPILLIVALAGLVHFVGYSLLRVPPFHWYYIPQVVTIILLGSLGLGVVYRTSRRAWQKTALWGISAMYFLTPALGMVSILARDDFVVSEMPIHSNWGTHEQYKGMGLWLRREMKGETIRLEGGEIGTLSYYCDCLLLDRFSDRSWLIVYLDENASNAGLASMLWRVNFAFYSPPDFPPDSHVLRAYIGEPNDDTRTIKIWETSTAWIRQGFVVLSGK